MLSTDPVKFPLTGIGRYTYELGTIDVQQTTLHDTPGYDDETGVGTPDGPLFFLGLALVKH